ncbi:MAG: methylmalonyl-CoA epimerase [Bacteroidetes bacterium]|jgi:methylmalonyl-CoA/ethylmalonyl-CoA epimerase|nr:methylmalonyl-CoA epimerase [Bacteroidota bacterium]
MSFLKISHIAIAVENLEVARKAFETLTGNKIAVVEEVPDQRVRVGMLPIGESRLELAGPTDPSSTIAKFIEKRGEGIHHICFEVEDIRAELVRLKNEGFQLIDEQPRLGADGHLIAFIHPRTTGGVLVELSEKLK